MAQIETFKLALKKNTIWKIIGEIPNSKIDWRMWSGAGQGFAKDAEKLKMMLLAWNYHNQTQGKNYNYVTKSFSQLDKYNTFIKKSFIAHMSWM